MNELLDNKVYLNAEYLPLSEAKISVLDRGFLFGDGVYEMIPSYAGRLFRLQDHLDRLQTSLEQIRLEFSCDLETWQGIINPLLDPEKNQAIYLQITRGIAPLRDHPFPENPNPTVFVMCSEIKPFPGLETGVKALTMEDSRWEMCHVKATTLLANVLLKQEAKEQGCAEAILTKNGYVTEGATSNLFTLIKGKIVTPEKTSEILPGITRKVILELARNNSMPVSEARISVDELQSASEIWISSSTREIIPVVELDSKQVGDGKTGQVWQKMNQLFQQYKSSV
jgi:D-alanine transaminase